MTACDTLWRSGTALTALLLGCTPGVDQATSNTRNVLRGSVAIDAPPLVLAAPPLPFTLIRGTDGVSRGTASGDTTVRLIVRPNPRDNASARLCGVLATGALSPTPLAFAWPVDSAAPRLAQRILARGDIHGVRFVVPGADARYVFEGVARDGSQVVSMQWPVRVDPAHPIPVGAPDSVVEAALQPSVFALDSLVTSLRFAVAPDTAWPSAPVERPLADDRAVIDVRALPVHPARLSIACPEATLALPMYARADHTIKIQVTAGDVITAHAGVGAGTVRISFDEAPPTSESAARESVPRASIEASASGEVTLRVRLAVLPKAQLSRQTVLVRLQRFHPQS